MSGIGGGGGVCACVCVCSCVCAWPSGVVLSVARISMENLRCELRETCDSFRK